MTEEEWEAFMAAWLTCPTPDCAHKVCLWGGLGVCFPCSARLVGRPELDRRYHETHPEEPTR